MYQIVQAANHNAVYASGFYNLERAKVWLSNYNPQMWDDKTITVDQLCIVDEKTKRVITN